MSEVILPPRIRTICQVFAQEHAISIADLVGKSQSKNIVMARRKAIHALRRTGLSLPEIARYVGKHHTSVLSALRQPLRDPKTNKVTQAPYQKIINWEIPCPDLSGEWAI